MNKISEIKIGALISYLTIVVNIVLGLVYTPWTLKVIGSSDYGLYTLTSSLISIFLLINKQKQVICIYEEYC